MTFVESYLKHTEHYESPESFWRWSAYTAIGAVLRDSCHRQFGDHKIYPNLYTLILADSAVHRKGHPIKLAEDLVRLVRNTKLIAGRASIQGILDELSRSETDKKSGKTVFGGSALFSASELSAGIVNDSEAIKILTDLYDFKDEYTSRLRGSGVFRIKNVCLSMLAASNEELLRDLYDTKAIFGGLLGRTFLVKPNQFRPGNSLFNVTDRSKSFEELLSKLLDISKLSGEFTFSSEAQEAYETWYYPFRKSYENKPDRSGILGRIHTSVLKLSMVICVDQTGGLSVEPQHINEAIQRSVELLPNYQGFIMSSGKSDSAEIAAILIEDIWKSKNKKISKQDFLGRHIHMVNLDDLDKCVTTLIAADFIKSILDPNTMKEDYVVTTKCIEKFDLKD